MEQDFKEYNEDVSNALWRDSDCEIKQLRQRVQELEKERDKATQYWQIAEGRCDALKQQRDELLAALARTRNMIRSCPDAAEACANDAIAAVRGAAEIGKEIGE